MGQRLQMPRYLHHPVFWYPYYFFTPPFLQVCNKLAGSKFVQIRFPVQCFENSRQTFCNTTQLSFHGKTSVSDASSVCAPSSDVILQGNHYRVFSQAVSLVVVRIKFH